MQFTALSTIGAPLLAMGVALAISAAGAPGFAALILVVAAIVLYFAPALIALGRQHPNTAGIFVLDLFLGWSGLGWVGALVWAYSGNAGRTPPPAGVSQARSSSGGAAAPKWDGQRWSAQPVRPWEEVAAENKAAKTAAATPKASTDEKVCPFCAEIIKAAAIKCKHCGSDLSGTPAGA